MSHLFLKGQVYYLFFGLGENNFGTNSYCLVKGLLKKRENLHMVALVIRTLYFGLYICIPVLMRLLLMTGSFRAGLMCKLEVWAGMQCGDFSWGFGKFNSWKDISFRNFNQEKITYVFKTLMRVSKGAAALMSQSQINKKRWIILSLIFFYIIPTFFFCTFFGSDHYLNIFVFFFWQNK